MIQTPSPAPDPSNDLWRRDEALCRAERLIERSAGRIRAVSFDFFDTLVWRLVAKPTDLFVEAGRRLAAAGLLDPNISPAEYEVLRRHAEIKVRDRQMAKDSSREDISLREICEPLARVVKDPEAVARIEHALECELCQMNPMMAGFVRHLHRRGLKLLVISDIYLSAAQLKEILRANQFDPQMFELVLASSEEGVSKGTGNLFRLALKKLKLEPDALLHIGDNYLADVTGARKAAVRGCHYPQNTPASRTILEREAFLLGGRAPVFSANSLRLLASRLFPADTDEGFFGGAGAFLMGPVLARFAGWACDQFVASGVRKVGALMREGELFGELLRREAAVRGLDLEITPLYINRRATDLAGIGRLTAKNLIAWLEARPTLPIRAILRQFGLDEAEFKHAPFSLDEKLDQSGKVLELAKFLFAPKIAQRIEAKSAEERRKLLDYMRPWIEGGAPFGVCDIGYSASAQTQLQKILEVENISNHVVGCYLVGCERAASRVLDGVDIRTFLGAFGRPNVYYNSFTRSPAFMEMALVASVGTTLGYERRADGSVVPVLDRTPYDAAMIRRQQAFKQGVLEFQGLWHGVSRLRPGLLDGTTEFSRRLLADLDAGFAPILSRVTAFPLPVELERFGSLALDDHYFEDDYKVVCGDKDVEILRRQGYTRILGEAGVLWPQGVYHKQNPSLGREFFSLAKAMLLCSGEGDEDGVVPEVAVLLHTGRNPAVLRECLTRLKATSDRKIRLEVVLLLPPNEPAMMAAAYELGRQIMAVRLYERPLNYTPIQQMNAAADSSTSPFILFADEGVLLSPGWDGPLLQTLRSADEVSAALPVALPAGQDPVSTVPRCVMVRRTAFSEGLGLNEGFNLAGSMWNLLLRLQAQNGRVQSCPGTGMELRPADLAVALSAADRMALRSQWPDFDTLAPGIGREPVADRPPAIKVDWIGSYLDHGSLSQVNREMTAALESSPGIRLSRVTNGARAVAIPAWEKLARSVAAKASPDAGVTVRHAWPPDWQRPASGKLVVIQPWEFGFLPKQWVEQSATVDEFWVPSVYVRKVYVDSGVPAAKVAVVPNGIDPEKFNPQAAPAKLATQKRFKFLFVGGTIFRKGPDALLKAYLQNFTAADDVCLMIKDFGGQTVYAGQTFESAIRAAQAVKDAPEILYINEEMAPESLPGLYTACDCLVLPYRGEGFGLPALEAMACGLPVVVTAGGATDDFVRDEFAWRVPAQRVVFGPEISGMKLAQPGWLLEPDLAALGRSMREAFTNPDETRRRGQLAARHARQACSWQSAAIIAAWRLAALVRPVSTVSETPVKAAQAPTAKITLPPAALVGHLAEARELLRQKKLRAAWESTLAMLVQRPFHPEAFLHLAEIALAASDGQTAKLCAEHARRIAPEWKPAKKFLNQRLKGGSRPEWMKLPAAVTGAAPRLSVCLIVKNEEKFLGQCLKSVRELAAQIVIVDTGSTDRTVEIAKEHGAEVHHFTWCDDFSAARNAALEHATGDWVLMLDADEELAADSREHLRRALSEAAVMAWRLPMIDVGREADGYSHVPRLFRNAPGLFYIGRVHEQVFSSVEVRRAEWGLDNRIGEAVLIHHGYTEQVTRDRNKIERNLGLLERALTEFPGEPHLLMNLGLELSRSGRNAESLERYREAYTSLSGKPAAEIVPELRETLLTQLCSRLTAEKHFEEVARVLTSPLARMDDGLSASLHFSLGLAQLELKRFSEAANQMRQCLAKRGQRSLAPIIREINSAAPHHCLALALAGAGDAGGADESFREGLRQAGNVEPVRRDYARFLAAGNRHVEALQQLHEVVKTNPQDAESWRFGGEIALGRPEFVKFAGNWTGEAARHFPGLPVILAQHAEALMLAGDTTAAMEVWERVWNQVQRPPVLAALILCETLAAPSTHMPQEATEEAAVSRAFIAWYRKLLAFKANRTVVALNEHTEKLSLALPTAAGMLDRAMTEAKTAAPAAN